jgi:hypothetical protein
LIFVEGFCNHQTTLQTPLKKGAPRLLVQGWKDGVNVQLLPVWIRFNSFTAFPKEVGIHFGTAIGKDIAGSSNEEALLMQNINKETERQLQQLSQIQHTDIKKQTAFLLLPAILGMLTHLPLFVPVKMLAQKFRGSIHYDSILFTVLALAYPFYLMLAAVLVFCTAGGWAALVTVLLLPLSARSYTLWK